VTCLSLFGRGLTTRRLIVLLLVASLPAACASGDVTPSADRSAEFILAQAGASDDDPSQSLTGTYLAGRHAQAVGDLPAAGAFLLSALERDPNNVGILRRTHLMLLMDGRVDEALVLARRLVDLGQDDMLAHLTLTIDALHGERFTEAQDLVAAMPENFLSRLLGPTINGWALAGAGEVDDAMAALESLNKRSLSKTLYHLHAALIADAAGRTDTADLHYRQALERDGGRSTRLAALVGNFYERQGRGDEAAELYQTILDESPGTRLMRAALDRVQAGDVPEPLIAGPNQGVADEMRDVASALAGRSQANTALAVGQLALRLVPGVPELQILVAGLLVSAKRDEDARRLFEAVDPASPYAWEARLSVAHVLNRMDRVDEAESHLRAMAREAPTAAEPLVRLGDLMRQHERFEAAVDAYDAAFDRIGTVEHRHWRLLYHRGMALERSKMWPRAEEDFLKALEFEPEQPNVLNYLGYSWVEQGQNLERALEMIRKAVELRPNDGYIIDSLGWAYYRLGRFDEAVQELERAVELRPQDPVINDHLGDAYWSVGREREARFQWHRALSLDPEPELRAAIDEKLARGLVREAKAANDG